MRPDAHELFSKRSFAVFHTSCQAFPGSPSIIHKFSGTATSVDGNSLEPVSDFVKDARYMMRPVAVKSGSSMKLIASP